MGEHSVHEINDLLSHVTPLFLRVFQHNRPKAAIARVYLQGMNEVRHNQSLQQKLEPVAILAVAKPAPESIAAEPRGYAAYCCAMRNMLY